MTRDEWRKELGRRSEEVALNYLQERGFSLRDRNYLVREGELDLVMEKGQLVVVVEVRSAATRYLASPGETVGRTKQRKVVRAAECYLRRHRLEQRDVRFDVVAVKWEGGLAQVEWIPNAFRPEACAQYIRFR